MLQQQDSSLRNFKNVKQMDYVWERNMGDLPGTPSCGVSRSPPCVLERPRWPYPLDRSV